MSSPTQYTMKTLRERGFMCGVVERFNNHTKRRHDLFRFIDVLAVGPDTVIGVQCCAGSGHAAHRDKILAEPAVREWLADPEHRLVQLWSWRKLKVKRGGRAIRWTPRVEEFWIDTVTGVLKSEEVPDGHIESD